MTGYLGEMYRKPQADWTTDKLDWKQLGLLAAKIVTKYKMTDENIVSSDLVSGDQCLRELIQEGTTMYKFSAMIIGLGSIYTICDHPRQNCPEI